MHTRLNWMNIESLSVGRTECHLPQGVLLHHVIRSGRKKLAFFVLWKPFRWRCVMSLCPLQLARDEIEAFRVRMRRKQMTQLYSKEMN